MACEGGAEPHSAPTPAPGAEPGQGERAGLGEPRRSGQTLVIGRALGGVQATVDRNSSLAEPQPARRRISSVSQAKHEAALRMQSVFRGRKARREVKSKKQHVIFLQAHFRGRLVRTRDVLGAQRSIKVTANLYSSKVPSKGLDWRLEALQSKHARITHIALLSLLLMVIMSEFVFSDWKARMRADEDAGKHEWIVRALRWAIFVLTVVLEVCIVDYHRCAPAGFGRARACARALATHGSALGAPRAVVARPRARAGSCTCRARLCSAATCCSPTSSTRWGATC